jgi:6-pyruvoyltetrahydropterin/6-carboxytetrahydropterin synthase
LQLRLLGTRAFSGYVSARVRYQSKKVYPGSEGLSCCFRQWRASGSHCRLLHGYALEVELCFGADVLDERNWVVDFGGLREVREFLHHTFDHTLLIAIDDPERERFEALGKQGLCDLRILPDVGCEAFARTVAEFVSGWLERTGQRPRVHLAYVEVREHAGNAARVTLDGEASLRAKGAS